MTIPDDDLTSDSGAIFVPTEFKFASEGEPGTFSGYGSVFGNIDSHGDIVTRGAFQQSLAEHKANNTMPGMFVEHSGYAAHGDPLPIGTWQSIHEDIHGLRVKGKISALNSDHGKRIYGLMQDGALPGLSIAYQVPQGGAVMATDRNAPVKRTLNRLDLHSVDVVRSPSNKAARVMAVKAFADQVDLERFLRSTGIARAAASKIAARGYQGLLHNDEDEADLARLATSLDAAIMNLKGR